MVLLKFQGKDITKLKQSQLRDVYGNIQMVFQNPAGSFDPRRTLGDGIGESLLKSWHEEGRYCNKGERTAGTVRT